MFTFEWRFSGECVLICVSSKVENLLGNIFCVWLWSSQVYLFMFPIEHEFHSFIFHLLNAKYVSGSRETKTSITFCLPVNHSQVREQTLEEIQQLDRSYNSHMNSMIWEH